MRGYGIAQSETNRPRKSPLANPSACGPVKSSSSASLISFCRWISASFINSHRSYALVRPDFSAKTGVAKSWTLIARRRGTKSWILPRLTTDNLSSDRFYLRNVKRNRPKLATVHREINRIFAKLWQTNLLNDHDEMRGDGAQTGREVDRQGRVKLGHHDVPVLIREV